MKPESFFDGRVKLWTGDMLAVLPQFPENSIDACVCDPPYHLHSIVKRFAKTGRTDKSRTTSGPHQRTAAGFMNKQWDGGDIAWRPETWEAVYRVLKPGAYLLAFGGSRTYGRLQVAIEDAGFVVYDMIAYLYGSGFPKSHNVSKAIDRVNGGRVFEITAAATDAARQWEGCGSALKPALEPICLAQKPRDGTIAENVLKWGCGALNIAGCRVEAQGRPHRVIDPKPEANGAVYAGRREAGHGFDGGSKAVGVTNLGRWPANVIHDGSDEVIDVFPSSEGGHWSGETPSLVGRQRPATEERFDEETGTAARFFYTAKADDLDRLGSKHPTVKPLDLMQYLVRLVTPPKRVVFVCESCNNLAHEKTLQTVREANSAQGQADGFLLDSVSGKSLKNPSNPVSDLRDDDGSCPAGLLLPGMPSQGVQGPAIDLVPEAMRGMREDFQTERSSHSILQPSVRGKDDRSGEAKAAYQDDSRLSCFLSAGASDGTENGICDGAPLHNGGASGAHAQANGGCASHKRDQGRQSNREFAGDVKNGPRQDEEAAPADDNKMSALQWPDETQRRCPHCNSPLRRVERGGVVLDPFAGTGTTGEAAWREGMNAVLVEREADYQADIRRRMALVLAGPGERGRETMKEKHKAKPVNHGPLFNP